MITHYFILQKTRFDRLLTDWGIHKTLGYVLSVLAFFAVSMCFFSRIKLPEYFYFALALALPTSFSDTKRTDFLKTCYSKINYQKLRLLENLILVLPFFLFLIFKKQYIIGLGLLPGTALLAFVNIRNNFSFTIPTPFYKYPYEFTEGFRKSFWVFVFLYVVVGIAIAVNNVNLGLVCILFMGLVCMGFYLQPEPYFYVWVFSCDAKTFIFNKIKIAIVYTTLACLPITGTLTLFYFDHILLILGFQLLGYFFVVAGLLSKYSVFPSDITLKKSFSLLGSIGFPPLMLVIIPAFYLQSIKRLKTILK